jgi:hypothetical protein
MLSLQGHGLDVVVPDLSQELVGPPQVIAIKQEVLIPLREALYRD